MRLPRWSWVLIVALPLVLLDQLAKQAVARHFGGIEGAGQVVIPGFFNLVYSRNPGVAFGRLRDLHPAWLRISLLSAISLIACGVIVGIARTTPVGHRIRLAALALILAGALGNLVDRIVVGQVTDFLEFYTRADWVVRTLRCDRACVFWAFNVADSCITVGVILLLLEGILPGRKAQWVEPPPSSTGLGGT